LIRLYRLLKFKARLLAYTTLLLVAVYVVAARVALSLLPDYRADLERYLSEQLGFPVEIQSLSGSWTGFDPIVRIDGISINGPEQILIERVHLRAAVLRSLLARAPRLRAINVESSSINLRRAQSGDWLIAGIPVKPSDGEEGEALNLEFLSLFDGADIALSDVMLSVTDQQGKRRNWRLPGVALGYKGDSVFASGQVLQPEGLQPLLAFSLEGQGVGSTNSLAGTIYLEVRSSEFFDELITIYEWQSISIQDVDASGRVWLDFSAQGLTAVQGNLQLREMNWRVAETSLPPLSNLATDFQWLADGDMGRLSLTNLGFDWKGSPCAPSNILVQAIQNSGMAMTSADVTTQSDGKLDESESAKAGTPVSGQADATSESDIPGGSTGKATAVDSTTATESVMPVEAEKPDALSETPVSNVESDMERSTRIFVDQVDVGCVSDMAVALEVTSRRLQDRLEVSEPRGKLANVNVLLGPAAGNASGFRMQAELEDVGVSAFESTPSGKAIDGYIEAEGNSGSVHFKSRSFQIGFPTLYLDPFVTREAEGAVSWRIDGDNIDVFSEGLRLYMPDDSLIYGDFGLHLNDEEAEDYLSLMIAVQDVSFTQAPDLVPYHAVGGDLHDWLKKALVEGVVRKGIYVGYGVIEDVSPDNSFTSSIHLEAQEGMLRFAEEWPLLKQLDADIFLQDEDLKIQASRASIQEQILSGLHAEMPPAPDGSHQTLQIVANTRVSAAQRGYWLKESPLREPLETIDSQLDIQGDVLIDLGLQVPMNSEYPVGYDVLANLDNNDIHHIDTGLDLRAASGSLRVSSAQGVTAEKISGTLLGHKTDVSIRSRMELTRDESANAENLSADAKASGENGVLDKPASQRSQNPPDENRIAETRIAFVGHMALETLFDRYELDSIPGFSGGFDYNAELVLPVASESDTEFRLSSRLQGVSRDWPEPLKKQPGDEEPLDIRVLIKSDRLLVNADVQTFGGLPVKSELLFTDRQLSFGQVLVGDVDVPDSAVDGMAIHASLKHVMLAPWLDFIAAQETDKVNEGVLKRVHLTADTVSAFGQDFDTVDAVLNPTRDGWGVMLVGPDIQGNIALGTNERPLKVELETLTLVNPDQGESPDETAAEEFDPRTLPELEFAVQDLNIDGEKLGAWSARIEPNKEGAIFRDISGQLSGSRLTGQLNWKYSSGQSNTILTLDLNGGDFDPLIQSLGWPSMVSSKRYTSNLALVWPGSPGDLDKGRLSGTIALKLEDGALKTADEKTGALRLFGIFNADTITRRLKLDFSDLYKSGISYDELSLSASMDQGRLTLDEPLKIDGPSSKYQITGSADLGKETLDMSMRVELPLSQNLPLAALLLGAPQVGGAVWLIDKILGEPLSRITTASYLITGTFSDPKLELKKVLNAK